MAKLPKFLQINENDSEEEKKKKKFLLILFPIISILIVAGIVLAIIFGVKGCNNSPTHQHVWDAPTYTWASDYSSCTAERVCKGDASHKETETANSTYNVVSKAKCEEDGTGRYYVSFENEAFAAQTKDIAIDALGHQYLHHNAKSATENEDGNIEYYSCERCPKVFSADESKTEITDTSTIIIPATGHDYVFDSFIWNDSEMTAKAHYICSHDNTHTIDYDADMSHVTKDEATCLDNRVDTYTASYGDNHDSKDYEIAETALGHNLIHHAAHEATCTEPAWDAYDTCSRCDYTTYQETSPALGHNFDDSIAANVSYEWVDLSAGTVSKTVKCSRDDGETQTTSLTSKLSVINDSAQGTVLVTSGFGLNIGDSVTVESTPNTHFTFAGWYSDSGYSTLVSTNNPYTFSISSVITLYAKYNKITPGESPVFVDGKIEYGLYPQTNVDDSTLVSALNALTTPESNGWYLYNNEYYAKLSATPYSSGGKFDNGTTIVSGTTYWFKCEPITWNVLNNNAGQYYIVSSVLLDAHCYYNSTSTRTIDGKTIYPNNYEYSDIRTWLNNDFYNSAFTLGNSYIQTTTVDNSASTTDSSPTSYACNNTQDKVFLPSYQDYINSSYGFSASTDPTDTRRCRATDWVRARGAYYIPFISYQYSGYYWTRSPWSNGSNYAWCADSDGELRSFKVSDTYYGVRPAISITIA